jgi:GT2 family glycosyltransferase
MTPTVSIVVPTYQRPAQLRSCLQGLLALDPPPLEVIVVRRSSDADAERVLREMRSSVREVVVEQAGQVVALQEGTAQAEGEIVAFTDDDAVPRVDWLKGLLAAYRDERIVAVGGRDIVHDHRGTIDGTADKVGCLTWYGRPEGNHHLGAGHARQVDFLKGVNLSIRRWAVAFPTGLRGNGAERDNDMAMTLRLSAQGYPVIYDPHILVDHFAGPRPDSDRREEHSADVFYNRTYVIGSLRPDLRNRSLLYGLFIGDRGCPGLGWTAAAIALHRDGNLGQLCRSVRAQFQAWKDARRRPLAFNPARPVGSKIE